MMSRRKTHFVTKKKSEGDRKGGGRNKKPPHRHAGAMQGIFLPLATDQCGKKGYVKGCEPENLKSFHARRKLKNNARESQGDGQPKQGCYCKTGSKSETSCARPPRMLHGEKGRKKGG